MYSRFFSIQRFSLRFSLFLFLTQVIYAGLERKIEWESFLDRHDMVWEKAPQAWHDGPFLGNGMLGSMIHQIDERTFRISVGRSDVEEHRTSGAPFLKQARLPIGYFMLQTEGEIKGFEGRVDLWDAEAVLKIATDKGTIDLRGIVHSEKMVIAWQALRGEGAENFEFVWSPLEAIPPARFQADLDVATLGRERTHPTRLSWHDAVYEYNSKPVVSTEGAYQICRQDLLAGGETGTAWQVRELADGGKLLVASIEHSFPEKTAVDDAVAHLKQIEKLSFEDLVKGHRVWWHAYYPQSFLSIEDTRMESFYWIQIYKFGSGARKGRAYMDTMGPWIVENTAWANGWFDLNTQLSYWFLTTANRMEVAESLFTKMDESFDIFVANMPAKYEGKAAAIGSISPQTFISPLGERLGFMGDFTWLCHDYWLMLQRTMDHERTKEKFFPLLTKAVNYYIFHMFEGKDGKLHLPRTNSPEYGAGEDCTYNLSLFRWGTETLIEIAERYGINDPLLPKWKDIAARLVEYPTDETGLMIAKDFSLEKGHRHYSHLLMVYPLLMMHTEQPENRELIKKSVDHWIRKFKEDNAGTGYSYAASAAMFALQGDGEKAASYLDIFMRMREIFPKNPTMIHPTTMYTETNRVQPVSETPFALCDSLQQMLLQSWNGKVRVFPAVPDTWENLCFDGLLAAGGFEVSALREEGETKFVRIKSLAGEPCYLKADLKMPVRVEGVSGTAVRVLEDGTFQVDLKAGEEALIFSAGAADLAVIEPVEAAPGMSNTFGMNSSTR